MMRRATPFFFDKLLLWAENQAVARRSEKDGAGPSECISPPGEGEKPQM